MAARKRHDPPSRPTSGFRQYDKITNLDTENRDYVLVNPNDEECGLPFYLSLGYELERERPDGPKSVVKSSREGGSVTSGGLVLVSCPIEERRARDAAGAQLADAWDRRMLKDGNIAGDGFRGQGGISVGVDSRETEPFGAPRGQ